MTNMQEIYIAVWGQYVLLFLNVSYIQQSCFKLIKKKTGIVWNMNVKLLYIFKMHFIPVIKAEFSASLLQSSVSKDP